MVDHQGPPDDDDGLDQVIARYIEDSEVVADSPKSLLALQERYRSEHAEHADALSQFFEDVDAVLMRGHEDQAPELERYSELELIGRGAMGLVFRAFDKVLGIHVAVKMPLSLGVGNQVEVERFRREAQSLARLEHPHIVRVFNVDEHRGKPFISMQLVDGTSLDELLDRYREDQRALARLLLNIARAVHHAHQRGILHRDLKPSNVLVACGEGLMQDHAFVCDFGLARPVAAVEEDPERGALIGTITYMSPEQAKGERATTLSDVHGLGGILYALLTGRSPFRAETPVATLSQVSDPQLPPQAPGSFERNVDRTLEAVCLKCLEKDPSARYRSAEDVAKDLERWLAGQETEALRLSLPSRTWLWGRRNPLMAALAAVLAGLIALASVQVWEWRDAPREAQVILARHRAETLELRLEQLRRAVSSASAHLAGRHLLEPLDIEGLQGWIERTAMARVDLNGRSPFESWFVVDLDDGSIIARWPAISPDIRDVDFRPRDYIGGLLAQPDPALPYVSQVFKALSDELYKFGISAALEDGEGRLGWVIVATTTTSANMGLPAVSQPRMVAALVARRGAELVVGEPAPPAGFSDHLVLLHPAYQRGDEPAWLTREALERLRTGMDRSYLDPVALTHPGPLYAGPWVAVYAPVPNSDFSVVVQRRGTRIFEDAVWLAAPLAMLLMLTGVLAARRLIQRRDARRAA